MKAVQAFVAWDDYLPFDGWIGHLQRHVVGQGFAQAAIIHILHSQQCRAQLAWAGPCAMAGKFAHERREYCASAQRRNFYSLWTSQNVRYTETDVKYMKYERST